MANGSTSSVTAPPVTGFGLLDTHPSSVRLLTDVRSARFNLRAFGEGVRCGAANPSNTLACFSCTTSVTTILSSLIVSGSATLTTSFSVVAVARALQSSSVRSGMIVSGSVVSAVTAADVESDDSSWDAFSTLRSVDVFFLLREPSPPLIRGRLLYTGRIGLSSSVHRLIFTVPRDRVRGVLLTPSPGVPPLSAVLLAENLCADEVSGCWSSSCDE
uniref:(northern house mosquito) hypothetical protein n=1 Tax=Culex pipiens TaxID=7175 RepID=A0A8D8FH86_CULPI